MQGFPDNWTDGFSKTARYKMIGNSVVPAVAEYVARGCKMVLAEDGQLALGLNVCWKSEGRTCNQPLAKAHRQVNH